MRKIPFAIGEYYHIYNRGTDKRIIFSEEADVDRFLQSIEEFNTPDPIGSIYEHSFLKTKTKNKTNKASPQSSLGSPTPKEGRLVNFVAYCVNPNHYHFILQPVLNKGVEKFMQRLGTGYTNYFNTKYERTGALFQGRFKSVHIDSNEYLLHVSAYVNLNDRVHQLGSPTSKLVKSRSSWREYMEKGDKAWCEKEAVLGQFRNTKEYKIFAENSLRGTLERRLSEKEQKELFLE
ncbi:MAG: transposase [Candidatus Moranbacteria bacterium]|nr:transposase [Candidatus Moranbacteria bacterium]